MRLSTKTFIVLMILIAAILSGCGNKTEVKYIVPTGYSVIESAPDEDAKPINVKITDSDDDPDEDSNPDDGGDNSDDGSDNPASDGQTSTYVDDSGNVFVTDKYTTVVSPSGEIVYGTYTPKEADINDLDTKLCTVNDVILGYVGCYYNEDRTEATVTLKDTGRGDVDQIWFYVVFAGKTAYMKADGFEVGNMNDYHLKLAEWEKTYGWKIQRILITPVVKESSKIYACNNRQLLLMPEDSCRAMRS